MIITIKTYVNDLMYFDSLIIVFNDSLLRKFTKCICIIYNHSKIKLNILVDIFAFIILMIYFLEFDIANLKMQVFF